VSAKRPLQLRIGELAERTGRSVHTIRWYERQGLLPTVPRLGQHRVYSNRHVEWLELMERLRRSGMTVAQMRAYTVSAQRGAPSIEQTRDLLLAHREEVLRRIDEWHTALELVEEKIAFYSEWIERGKRPVSGDASGAHKKSSPRKTT
jgi:DNA-binding transcriptional MerR regulator